MGEAHVAEYKPASGFGWLDIDDAASERTATLLKAFEESSTLDPIGLGPVRDAFSDLLFPGTSTIQTRLRYFVFIPWICRSLERDGTPPTEFASKLREREARLIDCLRHLGRNQGVIGRISGRDLLRMPSEGYWGGLGSWGIRRLDLTIREYGRRIDSFRSARVELDDDHNPIARSEPMWAALPDPPDDFLQSDTDMRLRFEEAEFIVERVRDSHPMSLMAECLSSPGPASTASMPWEVPQDPLSPRMKRVLRHARSASRLTVGAQELYNLLLAERARAELSWDTSAVETAIREDLAGWANEIERDADLTEWAQRDMDEFWAVVQEQGPVPTTTRDFVTNVVRLSADDPSGVAENDSLRRLVEDRERRLKGRRARLGTRSALEAWDQYRFGAPLEYRWSTARTYLQDLAEGLGQTEDAT